MGEIIDSVFSKSARIKIHKIYYKVDSLITQMFISSFSEGNEAVISDATYLDNDNLIDDQLILLRYVKDLKYCSNVISAQNTKTIYQLHKKTSLLQTKTSDNLILQREMLLLRKMRTALRNHQYQRFMIQLNLKSTEQEVDIIKNKNLLTDDDPTFGFLTIFRRFLRMYYTYIMYIVILAKLILNGINNITILENNESTERKSQTIGHSAEVTGEDEKYRNGTIEDFTIENKDDEPRGMSAVHKIQEPKGVYGGQNETKGIYLPEWVYSSKHLILYVKLSIEELAIQFLVDFGDNQQIKKCMQFLTLSDCRRSMGFFHPLTHDEMNMFLDMNIFLNRVSTFFDWPENGSISMLNLARAGFIYEGEGLHVRCFSCGLTVSNFPPEFAPFDFHREHSNNCMFLQSIENNTTPGVANALDNNVVNKPEREGKNQQLIDNTRTLINQSQHDLSNKFNNIVISDNAAGSHNEVTASSSLQSTSNTLTNINDGSERSRILVYKNELQEDDQYFQKYIHDTRIDNNLLNSSADNDINWLDNNGGGAKHPQFISIRSRLESFRSWPFRNLKEPRHFVDAGFFYTGKKDIVRCFFCDIGLAEWVTEDDPWVEHARHSPNCLFLIDRQGSKFIKDIQADWRQIYCPKHIEFEELDDRIRSFVNWPSKAQKPEQLASAGFYYTGEDDIVRCHYCDGGLRNWEEGDLPWTEHARRFQNCKFLVKMKGLDYVKEIAKKYSVNNSTEENNSNDSSSNTGSEENQSREDLRINAKTLLGNTDSEIANSVIKMGYPRQKVIDAIDEYIRKTGLRVFAAHEIQEILLQSEDNAKSFTTKAANKANIDSFTIKDLYKIDIDSADTEKLQLIKEKLKNEIIICERCKVKERCMLFKPCGHRLFCNQCSKEFKRCPKCNKKIKHRVKSYIS